jgi:hypothetical protein
MNDIVLHTLEYTFEVTLLTDMAILDTFDYNFHGKTSQLRVLILEPFLDLI